jgi:hypothetical protein
MAARGVLVHCSLASLPVLHASEEHLFELRHTLDNDCGEVLNEYAFVRVFLDLQVLLRGTAGQQVQNVLVIDLQVTTTDKELDSFVCCVNEAKDVPDSPRYDTPQLLVGAARIESRDRTHHGVCLSTACLPVCEHCSIVPLEYGFN